jgi:hypothetical protein
VTPGSRSDSDPVVLVGLDPPHGARTLRVRCLMVRCLDLKGLSVALGLSGWEWTSLVPGTRGACLANARRGRRSPQGEGPPRRASHAPTCVRLPVRPLPCVSCPRCFPRVSLWGCAAFSVPGLVPVASRVCSVSPVRRPTGRLYRRRLSLALRCGGMAGDDDRSVVQGTFVGASWTHQKQV